ncbi:hypothetical protein BJY17_001408 [Agromyces hippuratus]|uniref:Uncharacterized protein n=1 Tax=Agromyces hippuratus TaxID=286438 RepID=A0A852X3N7_9MICO|nr:hypothetical protein [Agromyces hippuratus]NYG20661.1 hypothetical protein [Agromyces hippuratus]
MHRMHQTRPRAPCAASMPEAAGAPTIADLHRHRVAEASAQ